MGVSNESHAKKQTAQIVFNLYELVNRQGDTPRRFFNGYKDMYYTAPIMEIVPFIIIVLVIISLFFFLGTKGSGEPMGMFPLVVLGFLALGVFMALMGFIGGIVFYIVTATTLTVLYYRQKEKKEDSSDHHDKSISPSPDVDITKPTSAAVQEWNTEKNDGWRDYLFYLKDNLPPKEYADMIQKYKDSGVLSEDFKAP